MISTTTTELFMPHDDRPFRDRITHKLPPHLAGWQLPSDWTWGSEGVEGEYRHYQELVDGLGRSLSLVSAPNPLHEEWLFQEARRLAHLNHPSIPTTYHYWARHPNSPRGPGYLRRWIPGETVWAQLERAGTYDLATTLQLLRNIGSAVAYLHTAGDTHGAISGETCWVAPTGRLYLIGWEWAMPRTEIPAGLSPSRRWMPIPPEWPRGEWAPTIASDQWQVAATAFCTLTGEYPPEEVPPLRLLRPELPKSVSDVLSRSLSNDPADRFHSVSAMLRELDRAVGSRTSMFVSGGVAAMRNSGDSEEARLRWATGEDYEVIARLGSGTFGSVWRVRDLTLSREVSLKMLHPHVSIDEQAVHRFRREAQLAAQLSHPAIVPIFDWDTNGGVSWYTMELAEGGSLADLVKRAGKRTVEQIAPQIDFVLDGLAAAHAAGIIHRDLKPENILIDRWRRWRIGDFGVAKISGEDLLNTTTGTPEFAAPEQLLGEPQGPAVDCFEIAAITAFLLTGKPPFGTGDGRVILSRMLRMDVDLEGVPPAIVKWIMKGLAPRPEDRYSDAGEMAEAWREAVDETLDESGRVPWWRRWLGAGDSAAAM
jgi:serine/threonine-protein kinase